MNYLFQEFINLSQNSLFEPILNFVTVFILAFTAYEGFKSLREISKANELKLLPLPIIFFKGKSLTGREITIKNVGEGTAYDIKIEDYYQILTDIQRLWKLQMKLTGTNVLIKNEERSLDIKFYENGKEGQAKEFLIFHLDPEETHERSNVRLFITYKNSSGVKYYCKIETGKNGLRILIPSKKIGIIDSLIMFLISLKSNLMIDFYRHIVWRYKKPYIAQPKNKLK